MERNRYESRRSNAPALRLLWPPREGEPDASSTTRHNRSRPRRRFPPEVLRDAEVRALMRTCGQYTVTGIRNRALIALLYRTGLRINEALSLCPKDLDLESGSVRVLFGKGGKARTVGVDPGAAQVVQRWLDTCSRMELKRNAPLFCTASGHQLSDAYVRRLLKRLGCRAGIDKRVHAHGLRHTHATQLRAEGIDIGIISKQLGHASISTTARYLNHLHPHAVIEAMQNRNWTGA